MKKPVACYTAKKVFHLRLSAPFLISLSSLNASCTVARVSSRASWLLIPSRCNDSIIFPSLYDDSLGKTCLLISHPFDNRFCQSPTQTTTLHYPPLCLNSISRITAHRHNCRPALQLPQYFFSSSFSPYYVLYNYRGFYRLRKGHCENIFFSKMPSRYP